MTDNKPTGKGRTHPVFPDRVGIAPASEVSNPECWLPPAVGRAVSDKVWRDAGGEYQDERTLNVEPGVNLDAAETDLDRYAESLHPSHGGEG